MALKKITFDNVSKRFKSKKAVQSISCSFDSSKISLIIGANGAGKTTMLSLCAGLSKPTKGTINFDGPQNLVERRQSIGMVSHESLLYEGLTARENLLFFAEAYRVTSPEGYVEELLNKVGLEQEAWNRPVATYSRGMRQRCSLARSIVGRPSLLLWDEPFNGLDAGGVTQIASFLKEQKQAGIGAIIISHDLKPLTGLVDHVLALRRGSIVKNQTPSSPLSESELTAIYSESLLP